MELLSDAAGDVLSSCCLDYSSAKNSNQNSVLDFADCEMKNIF